MKFQYPNNTWICFVKKFNMDPETNDLEKLKTYFDKKNSSKIFHTWTRLVVDSYKPYDNNISFSGSERSVMIFFNKKAFTAYQDDFLSSISICFTIFFLFKKNQLEISFLSKFLKARGFANSNLPCKGAYVKYPYDCILKNVHLDIEMGKLVWTQEFSQHRPNHSIFLDMIFLSNEYGMVWFDFISALQSNSQLRSLRFNHRRLLRR